MKTDPTGIKIEFDPTVQRMKGIAYHGDTPFDVPYISEIAPNLWQGGCTSTLMLPKFIKHVVSLYPWEKYRIKHDIKSEMYVEMLDSTSQGFDQVDALATWINVCRRTGPTLVHCQAGLNRSSLVAAAALIYNGDVDSSAEAVELLREKRSPACLCNPSFELYVLESLK